MPSSTAYTSLKTTGDTTTTTESLSSSNAAVRRRSSVTVPSAVLQQQFDTVELGPTSTNRDYEQVPTKLHLSDNEDFAEQDGDDDDDPLRRLSYESNGSNRRYRRPSGRSLSDATSSYMDYYHVLVRYPMFRAYLLSHICQHVGDWFVRIACLLVVEELSDTGSALAHLVLSVMLPRTIFAQVGGVLADRYDRRQLMIVMDVMSAIVVLGYLVAVRQKSLPLIYLVSIMRSMIGSAYYPVTTGIVPLLVPNVRDLQFAVTMNSWAWSVMAILGGTLAGEATSYIGLQACYVLDFLTFLLSATVVYCGITGNYSVRDRDRTTSDVAGTSMLDSASLVVKQLARYIMACGFGVLVLMKGSAALVWGAEDIIGVKFSTVENADGTINDKASSVRTGVAFSVIGIGSLLGPTILNLVTDANRPRTLQRACWIGLIIMVVGWLSISGASTFSWFLVGTLIRTAGGGVVWVNSTLMLQALAEKQFLGRVLAVEYTMYTLLEATAAASAGELFDAGLTKGNIAMVAAFLGVCMSTIWGIYHFKRRGAAQPRFNEMRSKDTTNVSSLEIELPSKDISMELEEDMAEVDYENGR